MKGRKAKARTGNTTPALRTGPSSDDPHVLAFYQAPDGTVPARAYLDSVPPRIRARIINVAIVVAETPPKRFAGGGMWEAMHGKLAGWFEIRVDGAPNRTHYRMYCLIDSRAEGHNRPLLVLVDGRTKAFRTTLSDADYAAVKAMGDDYRSRNPRPIA